MKHPEADDYLVGVVGCGAMGQGIAQVSATGGMRTLIHDAREGAAAAAKEAIAGRIRRLAEKGRMSEEDAEAAVDRLVPCDLSGFSDCDAVVEAVFEEISVKHDVFKAIEAVVSADCLIATNTSSIPISSLARACEKRGRVGGLHFFNPVPLMKLVEVIRAAETTDECVENLSILGKRMTRVPVVVKDSPGFLVNMGGRAFTTEGARMNHEGVATPAQIDAIMRDCRHFRMGPFELMDLTGIDVNFPVSNIVYNGYFQDQRLRTSPNHEAQFDAGLFGRKTGQGWFGYEGGKPLDRPSADYETDAAPIREVRIAEPSEALSAFLAEIGVSAIEGGDGPIVGAPVGEDATHMALRTGADYRQLVCLDLTGDTSVRVTAMMAPGSNPNALAGVASAIAATGRKVTAINDSPGFVAQRMCAMISNLGCYMAEIGLASPADIDLAMTLGLNYPLGPIDLGEDLGVANTLTIMEAMQAITGEDRYRPTMWLKRRARLGLKLDTA